MKPVIVMTQSNPYTNQQATIIHKPFIKIIPLQFDLTVLSSHYDWLIFSSKNAVKYFYPYLSQVAVDNIAVIGEKTADYCRTLNITVDFCPEDYSQEGFLERFPLTKNDQILLPSSGFARQLLQQELNQRGANVTKVDLYKPVSHTENISEVKQLIAQGEVDAVTFASSSAVKFYFQDPVPRSKVAYYVIGQQTYHTIKQYDVTAKIASKQTLTALVQKVLESRE